MASEKSDQLETLLAQVWDANGTDLILTVGAPPLMRVNGDLHKVSGEELLTDGDVDRLLHGMLEQARREPLGERKEIDFSFDWREQARVRGNAYLQRGSIAVALRMIPHAIPSFEWIGLPQAVRKWAELRRGLVFVTGPTGAGKSTTLAALIDHINTTRRCHIITIEDPIEYVYEHKLSAVDQREVGYDTDSFNDALRAALREDPDVLLVGEMRDLESIRFALTIAETGHLVFATLHTNDVAQSLDRVIDVFPADKQPQIRVQLANTLSGVCYQRLVPRIGGGQMAAYEVMVANSAVRNLIREGKTNQIRNNLVTGQAMGMQTLETSLSKMVAKGLVEYEEAVRVSLHPKEIIKPIPGQGRRRATALSA